jgi:hypothetical protein
VMPHGMTVRQYLKRRVLLATSLVLIAASVIFSIKFLGRTVPPALFVVFFLAFATAALMVNFGVRCLVCRGNLAFLFATPFKLAGHRRPEVCPYCASSLDMSVEQAQQIAARDRAKRGA